jgi:hypothetical protein
MSKVHQDIRMDLLQKLDTALYHKAELDLYKELCDIIYANSHLNGNNQRMLSYNKQIHMIGEHKGKFPYPINPLDRSVRPRFKALLEKRRELEREKSLSLGYIKRVMLETEYAEDFYRLLPRQLHSVIKKLDRFFLTGDGKFVAEAGEKFLADNQKYIHAMKTRMVANLIDMR